MFVELMLVVKKYLFANSPIGATMQDGGKYYSTRVWTDLD